MKDFDKQLWRLATAFHASLTNQSARGRPLSLPSHNWQQCEKLLQQIQRAELRGWHLAATELRADLHSYIGALQSEFSSLSTLLRTRPSGYGISTVGSVYHDLESLIEEFEEVGHDLRGHWISVTTEPITLEDIYLGPFEIRLDWGRIHGDYPYRVIAKDPQPAAGRDSVTHPHVADERLCEGEKRSGEYLFEIIMRRHQLKSTMMTSNRPLEDWGKLVGDVPAATAILDRLLSEAQIIQITGKELSPPRQGRARDEV